MHDDASVALVGQLASFASMGILTTTQEIAAAVLSGVENATPDLVAEETLALTSVATARAAERGLSGTKIGASVEAALLDVPFLYREYIVGAAILAAGDEIQGADPGVRGMARKLEFYTTHLVRGQFPGERLLDDKMTLWMGRISPPGLPEHPAARMRRLELVPILVGHLKLVLGYCRKAASNGAS